MFKKTAGRIYKISMATNSLGQNEFFISTSTPIIIT